MRTARQFALPLASSKRLARTAHDGKAHRARPRHCHRHPVHVTLHRAPRLPSLRAPIVFAALRRGFTAASRRWFRVVHFGVQDDHLHLVVEADDNASLSRGMIGLTVRLARGFNRALPRRGSVWSERFHARALRSPREVRYCLVYVLMNRKKHAPSFALRAELDPSNGSHAPTTQRGARTRCTGAPSPPWSRPSGPQMCKTDRMVNPAADGPSSITGCPR